MCKKKYNVCKKKGDRWKDKIINFDFRTNPLALDNIIIEGCPQQEENDEEEEGKWGGGKRKRYSKKRKSRKKKGRRKRKTRKRR